MNEISARLDGGKSGGSEDGARKAFEQAMQGGPAQAKKQSAEQDPEVATLIKMVASEAQEINTVAKDVKSKLYGADTATDPQMLSSADQALGDAMQTIERQTRKLLDTMPSSAGPSPQSVGGASTDLSGKTEEPEQEDEEEDLKSKKNNLKGLFSLLNTLKIIIEAISGSIAPPENRPEYRPDYSDDPGESDRERRGIDPTFLRIEARMTQLIDMIDEVEGGLYQIVHHGSAAEHSADQNRSNKDSGYSIPQGGGWDLTRRLEQRG